MQATDMQQCFPWLAMRTFKTQNYAWLFNTGNYIEKI